jgi:hypothetical protein
MHAAAPVQQLQAHALQSNTRAGVSAVAAAAACVLVQALKQPWKHTRCVKAEWYFKHSTAQLASCLAAPMRGSIVNVC